MSKLAGSIIVLVISAFATAQQSPVVNAAQEILSSRQKNMVAAAEQMPEDKYGFKPTPQQITFGHMVEHMAKANYFVCSKLSGGAPPQQQAAEKDGKAKLVAALRSSFDFCSGAISKVDETKLGDPVELFGGKKTTKAGALFELTNDWADHYAAASIYLRLNGLLPPTAKAKE